MTTTLEAIYNLLESGPPSLSAVLSLFIDAALMRDFRALIDEYVPDDRRRILSAPGVQEMTGAFCAAFERKYFPLHDSFDFFDEEQEIIANLVRWIPMDFFGISLDEYDQVSDWRDGWTLMFSVVRPPRVDSDLLPYLQEAIHLRGDIAGQLPLAGWTPEQLRIMTKDSKFEPLAEFAEWVHSSTGLEIMDCSWDDGFEPPNWNMDTVLAIQDEYSEK